MHEGLFADAPSGRYSGEEAPARTSGEATYPSYGTVLQLSLNYAHRFGDHNVSAMALYEEQYNDYDSFYAKRNMLLDGEYLIYGETSGQETGAPSIWDKSRRAFVGRVGYDFRGKYMADFSFREDGSSSFISSPLIIQPSLRWLSA